MENLIKKAETVLILSGEGEVGTYEKYEGKRTERALKSRLTKERCNGDRWAFAMVSAGDDYADDTFIELDGDLNPDGLRTVDDTEY